MHGMQRTLGVQTETVKTQCSRVWYKCCLFADIDYLEGERVTGWKSVILVLTALLTALETVPTATTETCHRSAHRILKVIPRHTS